MVAHGTGAGVIVPAATVVLVRDGDDGPEVLLVLRSRSLAFAGGHWVFPGGRVDPADLAAAGLPAEPPSLDDATATGLADDEEMGAAARLAAVRETAEETGLALDGTALVWFAHWVPPTSSTRRFATWFFAAAAPAGHTAVTVDGGEIRDHAWVRPQTALRRRDEGSFDLSPPTWVTLWQLTPYTTAADALAGLSSSTPRRYATRIVPAGDDLVALWSGDAGYESGDPGLAGARHRLEMREGPWRYQCDVPSGVPGPGPAPGQGA